MPNTPRSRRTRTLIQVGGLADKVGLLTAIGVELGADLQTDPKTFASACVLAAGFEELTLRLNKDATGDFWKLLEDRGRIILMEEVAE